MIAKTVVFNLDEVTNIALCNDKFFVFDGDNFAPIDIKDVVLDYINAGAKIPAEFVAVRDAVSALL